MAIQSGVFITSRTSRSDQKHHRNFYFWPHIFGTAVVAYMSRVLCSYGTAGARLLSIDHLSDLPFSFLSSSIPATGQNHFQRPVPPNNTLGVQFRNPGFKTKAIASARVRGPYRGIISSQVARKDVCQIILSIHRLSLLLISLVCIGIIINCIYPHNTSDLAHRSDVMLMQCYLERRMRKVEATIQSPRNIQVLGAVQSDSHSEANPTPHTHFDHVDHEYSSQMAQRSCCGTTQTSSTPTSKYCQSVCEKNTRRRRILENVFFHPPFLLCMKSTREFVDIIRHRKRIDVVIAHHST